MDHEKTFFRRSVNILLMFFDVARKQEKHIYWAFLFDLLDKSKSYRIFFLKQKKDLFDD